jgi:hypothetical protein
MPAIPALGRLRQEDDKFEDSLDYIVRICLKMEGREETEGGREGDKEGR